MSKTLKELREEKIAQYDTMKNKYSDFPVGTKVQIITPMCDFHCFYDETGVVVANKERYLGRYLGIEVRLDTPRHYNDGTMHISFNFEPEDLYVIKDKPNTLERLGIFYKWLKKYNTDNGGRRIHGNLPEKQMGETWKNAFAEVLNIIKEQEANVKGFDIAQLKQILQDEIGTQNVIRK